MAMSARAISWLKPPKLYWLAQWARDKLTKEEIANRIGITRKQLNIWEKYPIQDEEVKTGRFICIGLSPEEVTKVTSSNTYAPGKTLGEYLDECRNDIWMIEESQRMAATGYYVKEIHKVNGKVYEDLRWIPADAKAQQRILEAERPEKYLVKREEPKDDPLLDNYFENIQNQVEANREEALEDES